MSSVLTRPRVQAVRRCYSRQSSIQSRRHNQRTSVMHRKIGALFDLEVAQFQWDSPLKVVENNKAKIIWDFKFQPDAVMVNSEQKMAVIIL